MVRVTKKTTTSPKAVLGKGTVKELKPSSVDSKYFGSEPNYYEQQPDPSKRNSYLSKSFGWYSKFYGFKDAKEFIIDYLLSTEQTELAKVVKKAPDVKVGTTFGWLARLTLRGLVLNDDELKRLTAEINKLVALVKEQSSLESGSEKASVKTTSIQDIMQERTAEAGGELEGLFDDYLLNGFNKDFSTSNSGINILEERKLLPQHVNTLISHWENVKKEFIELQAGNCEQLTEAYGFMSKIQVRNAIKFIDAVISDLNGYISIKRTTRKPRARKAVSVDKIVSKLKYCKTFKDDAQKLNLTSISPTKLHSCSEAWVYDTKKRKMYHYVADEYSKVLTVKGNAVQGFDKVTSGVKTLRKPAEQIKELTGSKPAARKFFKEIKSVQTVPNGRFNENMIILKTF